VLQLAYLNSYYQTGLKNLLDVAVLEHAELRASSSRRRLSKVDEIPFDFQRRRMSVVVAEHDASHLLICKGRSRRCWPCAPRCDGETQEPLTPSCSRASARRDGRSNAEGLRVVAVAAKQGRPPSGSTAWPTSAA
jgi:Mg2+-importing ATPase